MINKITIICAIMLSSFLCCGQSKTASGPVMGWSSWNNFRVNINEKLIKEQADALISSGLAKAGYQYINVDDGYFGGRDKNGKLYVDSLKFPNGMDGIAQYIHSKGLRAGLYSEGGINTCGSIYDHDKKGLGAGMYGHEALDAELFFKYWKFDFIKVDWCGGLVMKLNDEKQYIKIIDQARKYNPNVVFNICRWQFPGEWAITKTNSWRISEDIRNNFKSILSIIDINRDLYKYASAGHYNDMDMLQVGRGMTYEEDKTHFSMWCMMNSPLLAGNDLRTMTNQTIAILTNKALIALNQDTAFKQAKRIKTDGEIEVWEKELSGERRKAIAVMNRSNKAVNYLLIGSDARIRNTAKAYDLWQNQSLGKFGRKHTFLIAPHGIIVLKIENN